MTGVEEDWRDIPEWESLYQASTICPQVTGG